MSFTPENVHCSRTSRHGLHAARGLLTALLVWGSVGCGTQGVEEAQGGLVSQVQDINVTNGITLNGITLNGITLNGITLNGLTNLHLDTSGEFDTWFNGASDRDVLMEYLVRCAVADGETRTYTNPSTGITYTWSGKLGLATDWASGLPATQAELQVVTACLASHTNKYGVHVNISLLGQTAQGSALPFTSEELSTYSQTEGCFFGNGFGSDGVFYVGSDHPSALQPQQSSVRACAMTWASGGADCSPLIHVGSCSQLCTKDASGTYYTSCTYDGVTYKPLTTRISPQEVYSCGDGVCQVSESCGTGSTYDNCGLDCGACAG